MELAEIKPSHFKGNYSFGSVFQKAEYEIIFNNMMVISERLGDTWGLTLEQYVVEWEKDGCFSELEKRYALEVLPYTTSAERAQTFSTGLAQRFNELMED